MKSYKNVSCKGFNTAVETIEKGYDIVIAHDLSNSEASVIDRTEQITGKKPDFYNIDVADEEAVDKLFAEQTIRCSYPFCWI